MLLGEVMMGRLKSGLSALLVVLLPITIAQVDLGAVMGASKDNQTIYVSGCEYMTELTLNKNLTIAGAGTIDGSEIKDRPEIGTSGKHNAVVLKDLVIRDFTMIRDKANLVIENCSFVRSQLIATDCTLQVKNSSFSNSVNGTNIGDGGAVSLHKVAAVFDHCTFTENSAFRNGTWSGGSGGAMIIGGNSTITLIEPLIQDNIAAFGGAICITNSTMAINGGKIMRNHARPVNYTNPISYFGGIGGAIDVIHSIVTLDNTIISGNLARVAAAINSTKDSEVRLLGNVVMSDNREI